MLRGWRFRGVFYLLHADVELAASFRGQAPIRVPEMADAVLIRAGDARAGEGDGVDRGGPSEGVDSAGGVEGLPFSAGSVRGKWQALDPSRGIYTLTWPAPVDTVTLSGSRVSGTNQYGVAISGTRIGACPGS